MALTAILNAPALTLLPTGPGSSTSLNPVYQQCDPTNGNYFSTTNRDLVTFYLYPASSAPVWSAAVTYTLGQVVNVAGSPPNAYIALAYYISNVLQPNLDQPPASSPNYWAVYSTSSLGITSAPDASGRTANVAGYNVPLGAGSVEFLVLPSSVFTQASGQVWFLASSNLVWVYIRSL
jgi:hypothetical protein